jgi:signal transduction histidine kinase
VRGDSDLLFQMLSNLVENAIVHTPPGTCIVLSLNAGPTEAVVHVRDDGPGVPSGERARLFQRFYRREASRNQPGYGLGLSLVLAVTELHGGAVSLETPPGGIGMDARVTLPLKLQGEEVISGAIPRKRAQGKFVLSRLWGLRA